MAAHWEKYKETTADNDGPWSKYQSQTQSADEESSASIGHTLRMLPSSFNKGVSGGLDLLLNAPANIANLGVSVAGMSALALGSPETASKLAGYVTQQPNYARRAFEKIGAIENINPQSAGERIADIALQGAGGALLGPSASMPALARTAGIGAASAGAGQGVTEATGSPLAGALASMAVPAGIGAVGARTPKPSVRSIDELKAASSQAYQDATAAGAVFKPSAYDNFVNTLIPDVKKAGFDAGLHPKAASVLSRIASEQGQPQTLDNMEILRRVVKSAAASNEPDERRIAGIIQGKLDDFVGNAGPNEIMGGNPAVAIPALQDARKLWSQASKADTIETLIDRAKLSAPNFSGSGMENAIRTEFRALAKNEKKMRLFTDDEQDSIRKVAMGGPVENAMRMIGKFAPTGVVSSGLSSGTGYMLGGPVGAAAVPAAGFGARQLATMLTMRNAQKASELMRGTQPSAIAPQPGAIAKALSAYTPFERDLIMARMAALQNQEQE
jgi:hypothetical protein